MSTTMLESLAQTRHAERYGASQRSAAGASAGSVAPAADRSALENTRSRAGWMLVGLGLRLALPGRHATSHRITLIGR